MEKYIDIYGNILTEWQGNYSMSISGRSESSNNLSYYFPQVDTLGFPQSGTALTTLWVFNYDDNKSFIYNGQYCAGLYTDENGETQEFIVTYNIVLKAHSNQLDYTVKYTSPVGSYTSGGWIPLYETHKTIVGLQYIYYKPSNTEFACNRIIITDIRDDGTYDNVIYNLVKVCCITGKWGDYNFDSSNFVSLKKLDNTEDIEQGGGYGTGTMPKDNISLPSLPIVNMSDTGATLYSLDALKMKAFRSWLWSSDWQDNIKKIRTDPMQNIIGISITDAPIPSGLKGLIYVGNVASTVEANVVSNAFVELDCGSISLPEYYGTFADYEPFCATTLYLPKVGFVQIPSDVCVNNTIHVVYHIELSSGEGLCYVLLQSNRDDVQYIWNTYTCHINSNIALSSQDHSQQLLALGNAIINTGISATNAIVNPTSAPQALNTTLSSCLDVAITKNPTQTRGNIGNMSAIMCYKKPYLLINRTNLAKPTSFQENNGYLINYTAKISGHTGFLKTRNYHAEFNAPYNHKAEIERIMNEGVFING